MKKILVTTLLCFMMLFGSQVSAKSLQFAQISDMHLSQIPVDEIPEGTMTKGDYLLKAIKEINQNKDIKFVIFSGDSINEPDLKTMSKFLVIADKLNKPYYLVAGEKEILRRKNFSKRNFMNAYKRHNLSMIFKGTNYAIKPNRELVFLFVDGTNEVMPTTSGYYNPKTLEWLDKQLKKYQNKKVVIVQHYPIVPPSNKIMHTTVEPEKYFHVINSHENVIAILSGHYHKDNTIYKNGIYHISAPAFKDKSCAYKTINIKYEPEFLFSNPAEFEIEQKLIELVDVKEIEQEENLQAEENNNLIEEETTTDVENYQEEI